jgi:choline dehydrogenase-like flavoprotein
MQHPKTVPHQRRGSVDLLGERDDLASQHGRATIADAWLGLRSVGENLADHVEVPVIFAMPQPHAGVRSHGWDAVLLARDVMLHYGSEAYDLMVDMPATVRDAFTVTPNVPRPRSRGTVRLHSADPAARPVVDPRYLTDPAGHDEELLLRGIGIARELAAQPALRKWVDREVAPGPRVGTAETLATYVRTASGSVFHPAGTCRIGARHDEAAVVDPALRVRGVSGLRIADASVFPSMVGVNPCLTAMVVGEVCAELIAGGAATPEETSAATSASRTAASR